MDLIIKYGDVERVIPIADGTAAAIEAELQTYKLPKRVEPGVGEIEPFMYPAGIPDWIVVELRTVIGYKTRAFKPEDNPVEVVELDQQIAELTTRREKLHVPEIRDGKGNPVNLEIVDGIKSVALKSRLP